MEALVNDTSLFYTTTGSGPPLLTLHGGLGWDHTYLRPWLDAISGQAEVVYYDHRGNGRSPVGRDWSTVDHETWVDDAEALRQELGFDQILLFGHSYGGFLALEYALRYPASVNGLLLCATAPVLDYPDVAVQRAERRGPPRQVDTLTQLLSEPVDDEEVFRAGVETVLPLYFHRPDDAPIADLLADMRLNHRAYNRAFFHCLPTYDVTDRLSEIRVPTLVLGGRHDWSMPPAHSVERLHEGLPNAELVLFERSGHFPFMEEPDVFAEVVTDWFYHLPESQESQRPAF